jgi:hypothetical protein
VEQLAAQAGTAASSVVRLAVGMPVAVLQRLSGLVRRH